MGTVVEGGDVSSLWREHGESVTRSEMTCDQSSHRMEHSVWCDTRTPPQPRDFTSRSISIVDDFESCLYAPFD